MVGPGWFEHPAFGFHRSRTSSSQFGQDINFSSALEPDVIQGHRLTWLDSAFEYKVHGPLGPNLDYLCYLF